MTFTIKHVIVALVAVIELAVIITVGFFVTHSAESFMLFVFLSAAGNMLCVSLLAGELERYENARKPLSAVLIYQITVFTVVEAGFLVLKKFFE